MTQDEIIRMAREAGLERCDCEPRCHVHCGGVSDLERFAALVAAHEREKLKNVAIFSSAVLAEREACAKVCEERSEEMKRRADGEMLTDLGKTVAFEKAKTLDMCAAAIRERSANARARSE